MAGKTKCRNHGGASLSGVSHPNYKHGGYVKYLGSGMAQKMTEAMADPDLMAYRQDIALLQARLFQLLETGESLPLWDKAQETFRELNSALAKSDASAIQLHMAQLDDLLKRGLADSLRWREIYQVAEQVSRTKEREHKREAAMQQHITVEQFYALLKIVVEIAAKTIPDRDTLAAFTRAIDKQWTPTAGAIPQRDN